MRSILYLFFGALMFLNFSGFGQAPEAINYQAVLRDAGGQIINSQSVNLKIQIRTDSSAGNIIYSEIHNTSTNMYGLVDLKIGQGSNTSVSFSTLSWGTKTHHIEVLMDTSGQSNYLSMGIKQLLSVPYALYAKSSGTSGVQGATGPSGTDGTPGSKGATGPQGSPGIQGVTGPTGADGINGTEGPTGPSGTNGSAGMQGATGPQGDPATDDQALSVSNDSLHISNGNGIPVSDLNDNDWYGAGTNEINPNIQYPTCYGCAGTKVNLYGARIEAGYRSADHRFTGNMIITPEFGIGYHAPQQSSGILQLGYNYNLSKIHNFNSQLQILSANAIPIVVKNDYAGKVSGMVMFNDADARFDIALGGSGRVGNHQMNWARLITSAQTSNAPSGLAIGHESANAPILFVDNDEDVLKLENKTLTMYADSSGSISFRPATTSTTTTYTYPANDGNYGYFLRTDGSGNLSWESVADSTAVGGSANSDGDWVIDSSSAPYNIYSSVAGNVGVGTSTPQAKLHISGGDQRLDGQLKFGDIAHMTFGSANMWGNYHENLKISSGGNNAGPTSPSGYFSGGVGISSSHSNYWVKSQLHVNDRHTGTASPAPVLKVLTISATSANGTDLNAGDGVALDFELPMVSQSSESRLGGSIELVKASDTDNNSSGKMIISTTGNDEVKNDAFTIDHFGNIGIDTTSPTAKLQINGGDIKLAQTPGHLPYIIRSYYNAGSLWFMPTGNSGSVPDPEIVLGDAHQWDRAISIQYQANVSEDSTGLLKIGQIAKNNSGWTHGKTALYTSGTVRMLINKTGNVGIATNDPKEKFHVSGNGIFSGNVGIGTEDISDGYALNVNGKIRSTEVKVYTGWADYVFDKDYKLMPLKDVEDYIVVNKHLPGIKSAKEIESEGLDIGKTSSKLMEKIEELTLYLIDANKKITALQKEVQKLKDKDQ